MDNPCSTSAVVRRPDRLVIRGIVCTRPGDDGAHEQTRTADRLLTMQVLYRLSYVGPSPSLLRPRPRGRSVPKLERETGFEPATLSLEG
jgi:hypothetical protein